MPRQLASGSLRCQLQISLRHSRPFAFILVLEEYEGIPPALFLYPIHPHLELPIVVVGSPQAQIAPIRGRHKWNLKVVLGVRDAQRGVMIAQQSENLVVEPRRMAE